MLVAPKVQCTFQEEREIVSLDFQQKLMDQDADVVNAVPGIGAPENQSTVELCRALKEGCWIRLTEISGLPFVLLRDAADDEWFGRDKSMDDPGRHTRERRIDKNGCFVRGCEHPIILPPMARYIGGLTSTNARFPIGGWVSNTDSDYLRWLFELEVVEKEFPSRDLPSYYAPYFIKQLLTSGVSKNLYSPLLANAQSGDAAQNETLIGSQFMVSPTNMTNITAFVRGYTYDGEDVLGSDSTGEIDTTNGMADWDIPIVGHWIDLRVLAEFKAGPEEGDVPAKTQRKIMM